MAEVWAAAAAVVAAGASAYGSYAQGQAAKEAASHVAAPISVSDVTKDSVMGNIANEPDIEALIRQGNSFNQQQNLSLLNKAIPGYSQISANLASQASSMASNPYALPSGVADNLTRLAAERGINTGVRGQANDYSLLRDFGVNELQYGQQNLQQSQSILGTLASLGKVNPMSPLSFYGTTQQYFAGAQSNQSLQQSALNAQGAASMYATSGDWQAVSKLFGAAASYGGAGAGKSGLTTDQKAAAISSAGF